jgi:hypothetical protein
MRLNPITHAGAWGAEPAGTRMDEVPNLWSIYCTNAKGTFSSPCRMKS